MGIETLERFVNTLALESIGDLSNFYVTYPLYFLAGILSSLFPCLYPLYPISAGFIRSRTKINEATWKHPLIYYFGLVFTYTVLGAIVATSGSAFNKLMQNGIVITLIGFLFLFLVFVCIDWFPLRWNLGSAWTQKIAGKEGSFVTFLIGTLAGLVASACVAPVLVGMAVFLAQSSASTNDMISTTFQGASLCFVFGCGIGIPFFITGVLGERLPRSGIWQIIIKYLISLAVAMSAIYQLHKGFKVIGWSDEFILMIFGGMLLSFLIVITAWRFIIPEKALSKRRNQVKCYFMLLAIGFSSLLIIDYFQIGFANVLKNHKNEGDKAGDLIEDYEDIGSLRFYRKKSIAYKIAQQNKQAIFIDFYAEWCANCKAFTEMIKNNQKLKNALKEAVLLKITDTDPDFSEFENDLRFPELKVGLPFFVVLDYRGEVRWKSTNYKDISGIQKAIAESH